MTKRKADRCSVRVLGKRCRCKSAMIYTGRIGLCEKHIECGNRMGLIGGVPIRSGCK